MITTGIIDVQRVGPSTGLPTRTMQGDTLKNAVLSHGDTRHPILFPSSPEECFTMCIEAFDLAEQFQTPVFVNMDLDLGMNLWMSDPLPYPEKPMNRGKVLTAEDLERLGGFARYKDVDGDGVGWRTLPGTPHPKAAYFTRGTGHTELATYSEKPEDWIRNIDRIARKFETLRAHLPPPAQYLAPGAKIGMVGVGTSRYAMEESREQLSEEAGIEASWMRLAAYPFPPELEAFLEQHERVYVIDQNRDAQLLGLMRLDLPPRLLEKLRSVRYYGGLPLDARTVTEQILAQELQAS
jgi:2-oxoglutarate ferredoxin oxidoreductase subunit alpha